MGVVAGCSGNSFCMGGEEFNNTVYSGLRAPAEVHGVTPCCNVLNAFGVDGMGEDGGHCCTLTSYFVRLLSDVLDESRRQTSAHTSSILRKRTYRTLRFSNLSFSEMDFATVTPSTTMLDVEQVLKSGAKWTHPL